MSVAAMPNDARAALQQLTDHWERRDLDAIGPPALDPRALLDGVEFVHVRGVSRAQVPAGETSEPDRTIDLVIGAHSYGSQFTTVFAGAAGKLAAYVSVNDAVTSERLLKTVYPGVEIDGTVRSRLGSDLHRHFGAAGMITGIPSATSASGPTAVSPDLTWATCIDRVIRNVRDGTWAVMIRASPRPESESIASREALLDEIAAVASLSRHHVQRSTQASSAQTNRSSGVTSETVSSEVVNRRADYVMEVLELEAERVLQSIATGRWQVTVYFGADSAMDAQRLGATLRAALSGTDSRPDPIRVHFPGKGRKEAAAQFATLLGSGELAYLVRLPCREVPGFDVRESAAFSLRAAPKASRTLCIGEVMWEKAPSGVAYEMPIDDLTRHTLVAGITGSGKTTTVMSMISRLWVDSGIPFLVIEPAKTEYRALLGVVRGEQGSGPIADLRVYTLGDETVAPFRLNPFEFDVGDTPGGPQVLSHIDLLKALFNAAFILYAPMPYVLETALHEVYQDKGWNLATGTNARVPQESWKDRHEFPIFPTLSDLYGKVEAVTHRLGYESRIAQDVVAGLRARIGALRLGSKGLMLDTPRGMPIAELLSLPTVLELESIGNDEEKGFLIGLIMTRIYGYRRQQAKSGVAAAGLRHMLVVEEAHRLLKNTNTQVDTESANLRAHAVETFGNMLSEVRHYGQGVIVAEQIPVKLTPDVVKNTNLKIVHRLLARDDREALAGAMVMTDAQARHLSLLQVGEAVAFCEGNDGPMLLRMEEFKASKGLAPPSAASLRSVAQKYIALQDLLLVPGLESFGIRLTHFGSPSPDVQHAVRDSMNALGVRGAWAEILARSVYARPNLASALSALRDRIRNGRNQLAPIQYEQAHSLFIAFGAARAVQDRSMESGWSYPQARSMQHSLIAGLQKIARSGDAGAGSPDLDRFVRMYEAGATRDGGPLPGCGACGSPCLYRNEVSRLLTRKDVGSVRAVLVDAGYKGNSERFRAVGKTLEALARQWLGGDSGDAKNLGFCAGLLIGAELGLDGQEQARLGKELAGSMLT